MQKGQALFSAALGKRPVNTQAKISQVLALRAKTMPAKRTRHDRGMDGRQRRPTVNREVVLPAQLVITVSASNHTLSGKCECLRATWAVPLRGTNAEAADRN